MAPLASVADSNVSSMSKIPATCPHTRQPEACYVNNGRRFLADAEPVVKAERSSEGECKRNVVAKASRATRLHKSENSTDASWKPPFVSNTKSACNTDYGQRLWADVICFHDLFFAVPTRGWRNNGSTKIKGEQRTADQLLEHGASDAGTDPVIVGHFVHEPK